jgi:transcription initiation factor TFIIH subunit 2
MHDSRVCSSLLHVLKAPQTAATELPPPGLEGHSYCYACTEPFKQLRQASGAASSSAAASAAAGDTGLRCPNCGNLFCFDCDAFIHEQLHNCPGCEALPPRYEDENDEEEGDNDDNDDDGGGRR